MEYRNHGRPIQGFRMYTTKSVKVDVIFRAPQILTPIAILLAIEPAGTDGGSWRIPGKRTRTRPQWLSNMVCCYSLLDADPLQKSHHHGKPSAKHLER